MSGFFKQHRLNSRLLRATREGRIADIAALLDAGAEIETRDSANWQNSMLGVAAYKGHAAAARLLIDRGAKVNVQDRVGDTPLMNAVYGGHADIIKDLLASGADKAIQNTNGQTAVTAARGKTDAVRTLLGLPLTVAPPEPEPPADPDEITIRRKIGDKVLDEVFNFSARERISLLRGSAQGPVEAMTRENFDAIGDSVLRKAFDVYAQQGGKITEAEVFPATLAKMKSQPRQG